MPPPRRPDYAIKMPKGKDKGGKKMGRPTDRLRIEGDPGEAIDKLLGKKPPKPKPEPPDKGSAGRK